ncbi:MAG: nucleotide exchange factor GrpE [Spirochaetota bacterium]|jgi:molecular chaperone GrpE|nr:nucleotide exchange factor GrpE [Spirochaetota bacterium]
MARQQHDENTDEAPEASADALKVENAALIERVAQLEEANAALVREEKYRLAEFDTFRRRARQEQEELRKNAARELLAELLDIEDGFAGAQAGWSESDPAAWREGIDLIARKFSSILEKYGVQESSGEGSVFDPAIHEAVFVVDEGEHSGEIVAQVLQRGYLLNEKVLRLARVKVARGLGKEQT